jgi:hypothetical protein
MKQGSMHGHKCLLSQAATGFKTPWIWSKDSNQGAREWKAVACGFVAVGRWTKWMQEQEVDG